MFYFIIVLKKSFVYKWSVLFQTLSSAVGISAFLLLWNTLYAGNQDMIDYMIQYTVLSRVFALFYSNGMTSRIGDRVSTGDFVLDLIKPINTFSIAYQQEIANTIIQLILRGIPIIFVYMPFLIRNGQYYNIHLAFIAIFISHILLTLMYSGLGFLAYTVIEIWPFRRILDDSIRLLGGGVFPLSIFGPKLTIVANLLPFEYLYSFPLEIVFGHVKYQEIVQGFLQELIWIFVFLIMNLFIYKRAIKKMVIEGG